MSNKYDPRLFYEDGTPRMNVKLEGMSDQPHALACKHGSLRRSCEICDLSEEVDKLDAEIERLRLELKQANAYLNDAMQKIDNLHIHIVRQDAEIESLKSDVVNAIQAYDTYVRMPSQGYNFRKEDAELAWYSALNQLRERVQ